MPAGKPRSFRKAPFIAASMAATLAWGTPSEARVTAMVTDSRAPVFDGVPIGSAGPYETLHGRVFGELDPGDPHNTIIQDIQFAPRDAHGKGPYIATFQITKPVAMSLGNQLMVYEISNRGGNAIPASAGAIIPGAVYVQSGWQGDLLAHCTTAYPCKSLDVPYAGTQQVIQVPVAVNADGSSITGPVYGHIVAGSGSSTQQMIIKSTPIPYKPSSLGTTQASFWSLTSQTVTGVDSPKTPIASSDWAWADCRTVPFPGTPDPTRICLKGGFNPSLLYEMVFTAKDPLVLGVGYAATRDVIAFFHHAAADDHGTANPVAGGIAKVISIGSSQSGAFIRSAIHLGFNQDESGQQVVDGAWPQVDGRQLYLNVRFALPDVDMTMYMPADESPVWWAHYPDKARNLPAAGMLDRCTATETCPKILETFGAEEFWDLKMSPDPVGTTADRHSTAGKCRPILFSRRHAWWRRRRLHVWSQTGARNGVHAASQSEPDIRYAECVAGRFRRLGDERHANAPQCISNTWQPATRAADAGGDGVSWHTRLPVPRRTGQSADQLRFRTAV